MINNYTQRTSLCRVSKSLGEEKIWLIRLADVENGCLSAFHQIDGSPKLFDNRDRLFWKNGPDRNGAFGIWEWSAVPNYNNPDTDYIETKYAEGKQVIEIITIPSAASIEQLIEILKNGIGLNISCPSVLLCTRPGINGDSNAFEGLLCKESDIISKDELVYLNDSIDSLPVYSLCRQDTITLDGKVFYRRLECDKPVRRIWVKDPLEIVRSIIIRRTSWSVSKTLGISRDMWQRIRNMINEIPIDSLYGEISSACQCGEDSAKAYLESFLSIVDQYVDHEDYDTSVMMAILDSHPELMKKCEALASERWNENHKQEVEDAKKKLDDLEDKFLNRAKELDSLEREISSARAVLEEARKQIQAQEQLADDVSSKVQQKIADARKDAAAFIAEMAFADSSLSDSKKANLFKRVYSSGTECNSTDTENLSNWKEAIDSMHLELLEAGVSEKYAYGFAAFLYSAFINHFPILLAGPNAEDIANAFSVSLFGRTPGIVDCSEPYCYGIEKTINASNDPFFIVKHAFSSEWVLHLPELQASSKYFFIVHPYVEDLLIEPKSMFSYFLPVCTELIIDSTPKGNYIGAKRTDDYLEYQRSNQQPHTEYNKLFSSIGLSVYCKKRQQSILSDFRVLLDGHNTDYDCLFSVFSYMFLTYRHDTSLLDKIAESMSISADLTKTLLMFIGEYNE